MRDKRLPKLPTEERLTRSAVHYLERYASSAENLRRVLERKVFKAAHAHNRSPDEFAALIDLVIGKCQSSGMLNDQTYAETKAVSLHRRGRSRRGIEAWLTTKGVDRSTVRSVLDQADYDDLSAAASCARRRRLGPWRSADARAGKRERDLAALCRAGFSFQIAQQVIDGARRVEPDCDSYLDFDDGTDQCE